ncbi:MAG: hypothetical protein ACTSPG_06020 [Candidatus Hodarchaeales archaeon]
MELFKHENEIADLFKRRCSLNEDVEEKALEKIDEKVDKELKQFIENETKNIEIRFIQDVEEKLEAINGKFSKDIDNLKKKYPLAYYKWVDETKKSFNTHCSKLMQVETKFLELISKLDTPLSPDEYKIIFLRSQIIKHFIQAEREIQESLKLAKHRKTNTLAGQIIKIITAEIVVILRDIELARHWDNVKEIDKRMMEDLLYWDLNNLSNFLLMLPSKKRKLKVAKKPKYELLQTLFG